MKRLLVLAAILAAIGLSSAVGSTVNWGLIDAKSPYINIEDNQVGEFGERLAALVMDEVDPDDLKPEVREQLRQFIAELFPALVDAYWGVDDLYTIKSIWLPVIKDLQDEVKALKIRVQSLEDHHEG